MIKLVRLQIIYINQISSKINHYLVQKIQLNDVWLCFQASVENSLDYSKFYYSQIQFMSFNNKIIVEFIPTNIIDEVINPNMFEFTHSKLNTLIHTLNHHMD